MFLRVGFVAVSQTSEDDFVSAPKMTVRCVAAKHPDSVGKNGKVSGGTCADGIMNADETGVDCGGADCAPCVTMAEQKQVRYEIESPSLDLGGDAHTGLTDGPRVHSVCLQTVFARVGG